MSQTDVLIVEDDLADVRLLKNMLSAAGYRPRIVATGAIALESVNLKPPSLILLDIRLPDMDGYGVCAQLKANPLTSTIPVLFISALNDATDKVKAFAAGALDYITKPYQAEELIARIEHHLTNQRLRLQLEAQNQLLQRQEERWQLLLKGTGDGIFEWNIATGEVMITGHSLIPLGYSHTQSTDHIAFWKTVIHPEDYARVSTITKAYLNRQRPRYDLELRLRCQDGSYKYFLARGQATWDDQGQPLRLVIVHQDISQRKQMEAERIMAQQALQASEAKLARVLNNAAASIIQLRIYLDQTWEYEYCSPGCEHLYGYTTNELVNDPPLWDSRVPSEDMANVIGPSLQKTFAGITHQTEFRFRHKSGHIRWIRATVSPSWDATRQCWLTTVVNLDITEVKVAESQLKQLNQKLEQLATIDGLTRVANRRQFDYTLQQEWQRLRRDRSLLALILLDIDAFKAFNDAYGHLEGDDCLVRIAQALQQSVNRPSDLVARYGGEEFVIVLPHTEAEGALAIADRIQQTIHQLAIPHARSGVAPIVTASMGIAVVRVTDHLDPEAAIARADAALYRAKQHRNTVILDAAYSYELPQGKA